MSEFEIVSGEDHDKRIIELYTQADPQLSLKEIAKQAGISTRTLANRLKKLHEWGEVPYRRVMHTQTMNDRYYDQRMREWKSGTKPKRKSVYNQRVGRD